MVGWFKRLIAAITAIFLLLSTGTVAHAVSDEKAVLIPGAMPFKLINPFYPLNKFFLYPNIGINFRGDDDAELIDYSQNPLASDWAIRQGVKRALAAVHEIDGKVVVIGESMGSMVAARVAAQLANSPHPPSVDDIRVVLMAPPEAGAAEYFKVGTYIPILNYRVSRVPESPYPTTIVIGEYDFWSDPPDRPWNLVSLLNAALGALFFVHGQTSLIDPADVPPENITSERNSLGATVTTYLVPTENLPLTQVLRFVVPDALVDILDLVLRPIVDAGYRRHDQPGDPRPYLSDGEIHWPTPAAVVDTEPIAPSGAALTGAPLLSAAAPTSVGQVTAATRSAIDKSGVVAPATSTESGGGSASAPVDATEPASEAEEDTESVEADVEADEAPAEPEAAVRDAPTDVVDPAAEAKAAEPESEPEESGVATAATGTVTEAGATPDGPGSISQNGAVSDNSEATGSSSPASAQLGS